MPPRLRTRLPGAECSASPNRHRPPPPGLLAEAGEFIAQFHAENPAAGPADRRLAQAREEIRSTGTYTHTPAELEFAARVAWRNSSRCIGRLYWRSLQVRDRRHLTTGKDVAAEAAAHLQAAVNGGRIRPLITVFAPDAPGRPGPRILSPQLARYAGWADGRGKVTGDPVNAALTGLALGLGWPGPQQRGRFDVLPLIVQGTDEEPQWHELPAATVLEVPLTHPDHPWFAGLGLRWHAVPVISDMYLQAGGIRYPSAPFNGWYMCTEIGSRDLGDEARYNQLPAVAAGMGLDISSDTNLWKDRALTELNFAVLHSFTAAGVTITDHHTESARFLKHLAREEQAGRACPADWAWIVPPAAGSACPVFHRTYDDFAQTPNFYRHTQVPVPTRGRPDSSASS